MKQVLQKLTIFLFFYVTTVSAASQLDLSITLNPVAKSIQGVAQIHLEKEVSEFTFTLHHNLQIQKNSAYRLQIIKDSGIGRIYQIVFSQPQKNLSIAYEGVIDEPITPDGQSPGVIRSSGVSLLADSYFYPITMDSTNYLVTVTLPGESWKAILPGELVYADKQSVQYKSFSAESEISLIADQFHTYEKITSNGIIAQVWLKSEDAVLAEQYLSLVPTYLARYEGLIGSFPFTRYTVVENSLETGYAFSGFTSLGPTVIRLPFILRSSLPHEILHSWWGNSVAVDSLQGNWCEGLTTYMADMAFKNEEGRGAEYRRTTLQGYQDFISSNNDFPVRQFIARNDRGTQAVGYGKSMMFFQMLENLVGKDHFLKALTNFYSQNLKKSVGFSAIQKSFEDEMKTSLNSFFTPWLDYTGAPTLSISYVTAAQNQLSFDLTQVTAPQILNYTLPVRIRVLFEDGSQSDSFVNLVSRTQQIKMTLSKKIKRLSVDPEFEVFRTLYSEETPISFSKILSDENTVYVSVPQAEAAEFQDWVLGTQALYTKKIKLIYDDEPFPNDGVVWILGLKNKHAGLMQDHLKLHHVEANQTVVSYKQSTWLPDRSSVFIAGFAGSVPSVWAWADSQQSGSVLMKKIGHYTSFSIAGFTDLKNDLKETWQVEKSPLIVDFK